MIKNGCFTLAYRAFELELKKQPFLKHKKLNSWSEVSWYFLLLWGEQ